MPLWFWVSVAFVAGAIIGSFLNVVIYRVPEKKSLVKPPSHCPKCNANIKPYDNIPIFSWLILGGHCRNCKQSISARYPIVEFITAVLYAAVVFTARPITASLSECVAVSGMLVATVVDFERMRIPTKVIYATFLIGFPLLVVPTIQDGQWWRLGIAAACGAGGGLVFFLFFLLLPPGGFGLGDVRLIAMQSAFLGWFGWRVAVSAVIVGFIAGGFIAMFLLATGIKKMKDKIPFGPYLALGALIMFYLVPVLPPKWII